VEQVPEKYRRDDKLLIGYLLGCLGEDRLGQLLVENFSRVGEQGLVQAKTRWKRSGLNFNHRRRLGLCIQALVKGMDTIFLRDDTRELHGRFLLSDEGCALQDDAGHIIQRQSL
jgi:hypothetical protein